MGKLWFIVAALFISACYREDTVTRDSGRRVEPRLSNATEWRRCTKSLGEGKVVADARCGSPAATVSCDDPVSTRDAALAVLPACPDVAIAVLERLAAQDPEVGSDLAAAYYVSAQKNDRPEYLLRALIAAEKGIAATPESAAARFNRALIRQELGLESEAIAAWETFLRLDNESEWSTEARTNHSLLTRPRPTATNDRIETWPVTQLKDLEVNLIAKREVAELRDLGQRLSKRLRSDRYPLHLAALEPTALRLAKQWHQARALSLSDGNAALAILDEIEPEARARHYNHLVARIRDSRGYVLFGASKYLEALKETEAALAGYVASGDDESRAGVHTRRAGDYRIVGQNGLAWREILHARRLVHSIGQANTEHLYRGEIGAIAGALGYPLVAYRYQSEAVKRTANTKGHAIALRERARIALDLERLDDALKDLERAQRLAPDKDEDAVLRRAYAARFHEVYAGALARRDPAGAVAELTTALGALNPDEQHTFRASLYAKRAEAHRRSGRAVEAKRDLYDALRELAQEEKDMLAARVRGEGEDIWKSYFSRFDETYESLVRQLVNEKKIEDAFDFAERGRAFETLDLILHHGISPPGFRRLIRDDQPIPLGDIQASLPAGTFLIQYDVQEERTYTWILSRDAFRFLAQRAGRADVERWTKALQDAAAYGTEQLLTAQLSAPYDELIARPLSIIASMPGGKNAARLVFVPDGPMHGLPFAGLRDPLTRRHLVEFAPPVSLAASATLYVYSLLRDASIGSPPQPSALLIGNPEFDRSIPLAGALRPLAGAEREVEELRSLYAPHAKTLIGSEATAARLLTMAPKSTILHFAGHAVVNPDAPWLSLLLLASSGGDSGVVYAQTLLTDLQLHETKIAVLSACSTAGGLPVGPEGVAPLVRPLIAAGVPAVIGSLWDVYDATAQALLVSFHRHYRQGKDAAAAMQAAQRELLQKNNAGLRSALAWAPFQVIGHASSPFPVHTQHSWRNPLEFRTANLLQRADDADSERRRHRTDRPAPQR